MGATFYGEVKEDYKEEYHEEWLATSSYFSFPLFAQQSTALCPLFPQLLNSILKQGFMFLLSFLLSFTLLLFTHKSVYLWSYLPHLLNHPYNKFPFLLFRLFSPEFNAITLSSGSIFYCVLFLFNSVFQNRCISFFRSLNAISKISTLHNNLRGL